MARHYAADDENRLNATGRHEWQNPPPTDPEELEWYQRDKAAGHYDPWLHSDMENWEGPSGNDLRQRMAQDEMSGNIARESTGLARGGGDEHIDAGAWDELAAEGQPDPVAVQRALERQQGQGQREALGSNWPYR